MRRERHYSPIVGYGYVRDDERAMKTDRCEVCLWNAKDIYEVSATVIRQRRQCAWCFAKLDRMAASSPRVWFLSWGCCPVCKRRDVVPGRTSCESCLVRQRNYTKKYMQSAKGIAWSSSEAGKAAQLRASRAYAARRRTEKNNESGAI